jgi:prepilin-type N-terminal cleavage/methylation domain-containing protein
MSDDGYTLVEMLAALAIVALAMAGLAEGARTIGRIEASATRTIGHDQALARAERGLARVFAGAGPFKSDDRNGLAGGSTNLTFVCGSGAQCAAGLIDQGGDEVLTLSGADGWTDAVRLPGVRQARFTYGDGRSRLDDWPPGGSRRERLRSVAIVATSASEPSPIVAVRLWAEQAADCQFDPVIADCRGAGQ